MEADQRPPTISKANISIRTDFEMVWRVQTGEAVLHAWLQSLKHHAEVGR